MVGGVNCIFAGYWEGVGWGMGVGLKVMWKVERKLITQMQRELENALGRQRVYKEEDINCLQ